MSIHHSFTSFDGSVHQHGAISLECLTAAAIESPRNDPLYHVDDDLLSSDENTRSLDKI